MVKKVAALAFRKSIRKTEKTQENMAPALRSSSSVSFAFSVPTAGAVGAGERKLRMNPEVSGLVAPRSSKVTRTRGLSDIFAFLWLIRLCA